MTPVVQGDIMPKVSSTLEKSIEETGGVAAILFLVAKVGTSCGSSGVYYQCEKIMILFAKFPLFSLFHKSR